MDAKAQKAVPILDNDPDVQRGDALPEVRKRGAIFKNGQPVSTDDGFPIRVTRHRDGPPGRGPAWHGQCIAFCDRGTMFKIETTQFTSQDDLPPEIERRLQVEELWARRNVLAELMNAER